MHNGDIAFDRSAVDNLEVLVTLRKALSKAVYMHPKSQNLESVLKRAVKLAFPGRILDVYKYNDGSLKQNLSSRKPCARLAASLRGKNEYVDVLALRFFAQNNKEKRIHTTLKAALEDGYDFRVMERNLRKRVRALTKSKIQLGPQDLMVEYHHNKLDFTIPKTDSDVVILERDFHGRTEPKSLVKDYGISRNLTGRQYYSPIVASVYTPKEHVEIVRKALKEELQELDKRYTQTRIVLK